MENPMDRDDILFGITLTALLIVTVALPSLAFLSL